MTNMYNQQMIHSEIKKLPECEGCIRYKKNMACLFSAYSKVDICPCINCIVKITCEHECELRFEKKLEINGSQNRDRRIC